MHFFRHCRAYFWKCSNFCKIHFIILHPLFRFFRHFCFFVKFFVFCANRFLQLFCAQPSFFLHIGPDGSLESFLLFYNVYVNIFQSYFCTKGERDLKRLLSALACLIIICSAAISVSASTAVSGGTAEALVSSDGSCQITLDLTLQLDGSVEDLVFPIPAEARNVTVNGNSASTSNNGITRDVKLSSVLGSVAGNFTIRIQYTLPNVVAYDAEERLMLTLPLLSGFNYPVAGIDISITLPDTVTGQPTFSSGYHLQTIESGMTVEVAGSIIRATVNESLKDRETLTMTLKVPEEMFPQAKPTQWAVGTVEILMAVLAGLALIYWVWFLRSAPIIGRSCAAAPEGYTAGELSGLLCGYGNDLTMMLFSWAQLGYVTIHVQRSGRVTLYKRMDMGNERDPGEVRFFNALFGRRDSIDGTGRLYASLCRKAAVSAANPRDLYRQGSGNPRLFRYLCAGIGLLGGISLGYAMVGDALLGMLLIAILAIFGGISSWLMQDWVRGLHLRSKPSMTLAVLLCGVWMLLGMASGIWNVAICVIAAQLICGLATGYGGRRTPLGRQLLAETLGLRRYLNNLTPQDIQRICRIDPDYFFSMAPYALALGVLKPFARKFGNRRFPPCSYLSTGSTTPKTAYEWAKILDHAADSLDARQLRMSLERFLHR